jgi:type IV pilus assembly protein PilB
MHLTNTQLKKILVRPGHISEKNFNEAKKEASRRKETLREILIDSDLIKDEELGQLVAEEIGFPFVNLRTEKIDDEILSLIPEPVARAKGIIAFKRTKKGILVAMTDPDDTEEKNLLERKVGESVIPCYITPRDFQNSLAIYKKNIRNEFDKMLSRLEDKKITREERDETTVEMVDALLQYGYHERASDIHIEPAEKAVLVRVRIDGIMHDIVEVPKEIAELMLTRIKILSKMRTDEHRAAQDGKLQFEIEKGSKKNLKTEKVDVRVSIVPVTEGENVVMRLLSAHSRQLSLTDLGFTDKDLRKTEKAMTNPHGMLLVTGPTGSGKTTTLYAILKQLNKRQIHIATIEDPVEYDIEGVSQIQVNQKTNLTFAKGLRAIVRQDPDIIMVGEIRDEETAGIAVNSALTGHLVLSTLHTNDAATAIPRLLDMKVEPFLVASTVRIVIAQRLVRKICARCRESYTPHEEERNSISEDIKKKYLGSTASAKKLLFYKGAGCKVCGTTGFKGRIGIFEILEVKENVKELIVKRASSGTIKKQARKNGTTTMLEDGIEKVLAGQTTLEEVLKAARE